MLHKGCQCGLVKTLNTDALDTCRVELRGPNTSPRSSEGLSVAVWLLLGNSATRSLRAICSGDCAATGGVNGHLVRRHEVDGL